MKSVLSGGMYVGKDTAHEIYGDNFYENRAVNFVQPFSKKWRSLFFDSLLPLLRYQEFPAIIVTKNKNAAACGWGNTRRPAQVSNPPTQRPKGRTAWNMIRQSGLFVKGGFVGMFRVCVA